MKHQRPSIIICVVMDLIGYASFIIPGFGEFSDVIWAPLSGYIFYKLFGGWKGKIGGIFNFIEEILPFSDVIPTFTIMWIWQYFTQKNEPNNIPQKQS